MAREITYNNFEISLMVFMPYITTNHAITHTNLNIGKQGSTLTLTRSPLESNISAWKVKKANEPKILARSGNYF